MDIWDKPFFQKKRTTQMKGTGKKIEYLRGIIIKPEGNNNTLPMMEK